MRWKSGQAMQSGGLGDCLLALAILTCLFPPKLVLADIADDTNRPGRPDVLSTIKPIEQIRTGSRTENLPLPVDESVGLFSEPQPFSPEAVQRRDWADSEFYWLASEFSHQPLYFDDEPLERYGQTRSRLLQPEISGIHFFGSIVMLPYTIIMDRPAGYTYPLGYDLPGNAAPPTRVGLRLHPDPAWAQPGTFLHRHFH